MATKNTITLNGKGVKMYNYKRNIIAMLIMLCPLIVYSSNINRIYLIVLNPAYIRNRMTPEKSLIEASTVLLNLALSEEKNKNGGYSILDKYCINLIGETDYSDFSKADKEILKLFEQELDSNYKYNPEDFKDNKAFLVCLIGWKDTTTFLSIDTDYRMHYNGKHIEYKEELIKAIMPYIPEEFLEHIILYIPINSTRKPNDPEKE